MSVQIDWKFSELPEETVIEVEGKGRYAKTSNGYGYLWQELSPHCGDCEDDVYEQPIPDDVWPRLQTTVREKADDFFGKDFTIIAVPKSWYEEFRPMVGTPWEINREGHVRNLREERGPFVRHNVPKGDVLSIWTPHSMNYEEMTEPLADVVRKAFS